MAGRLDGKVAVVTGAGSGIGRAIAGAYCAEGARVVICDITGEQDDAAAELGDAATAVHADVTSDGEVEKLLDLATSTHGRLDVLVNNAGIEGAPAPIADCTPFVASP